MCSHLVVVPPKEHHHASSVLLTMTRNFNASASQETCTSVFCGLVFSFFHSRFVLSYQCERSVASLESDNVQKKQTIYRLLIVKQTERICRPTQPRARAEGARFRFLSRGEEVILAEVKQRGVVFFFQGGEPMEFSEHIKTANVEDVVLRQPLHLPTKGTLCITGHHLLFSEREEGSSRQVLLLLRNIDAIEKR